MAPNKRYIVRLEEAERQLLQRMVRSGRHAASKLARARVLLLADQGEGGPSSTDDQIALALGVTDRTVQNIRKRFVLEDLEASVNRKPQTSPSRSRTFDGEAEAKLIALACSEPPQGRARWTMQLLADHTVMLNIVDSTSEETVRRMLKKTNSSRICAVAG
jgi:hypothetical protein